MSRSNNRISDYFLASAEHEGASLFPSGLLMYDLPLLRRTASRTSNNVEVPSQQPPIRKQSPSPVPSVSEIIYQFAIENVFSDIFSRHLRQSMMTYPSMMNLTKKI
jgi:hypothetical protein